MLDPQADLCSWMEVQPSALLQVLGQAATTGLGLGLG